MCGTGVLQGLPRWLLLHVPGGRRGSERSRAVSRNAHGPQPSHPALQTRHSSQRHRSVLLTTVLCHVTLMVLNQAIQLCKPRILSDLCLPKSKFRLVLRLSTYFITLGTVRGFLYSEEGFKLTFLSSCKYGKLPKSRFVRHFESLRNIANLNNV